ncbi:modulator of macroautophagy TMEM150B isoform X1 [Anguilla anguilla]|uniref:modulator of macroautophagy TMEM150B isoform X1 n=1 Tax=Anguilla anguilla TaxID=7936 RepID=UPI0015AD57FD|nr:modulator of macroautophagy TMEM150B isoform X1 [Anguilla anguilla]XP_035254510.1 modulator of macroautophagy TMEM150B isoform X1 [Anguilla anguilla]
MWAWALLPILLAIGGAAGMWAVCAMAVINGTVNLTKGVPYISECGTYNPQSCVFSQLLNICAFLGIWVAVLRFQQIRDFGLNSKVNTASLVLGFISALGISVLGNFQKSVLLGVHLFGVFLAFFGGLTYFWLQVWLTYKAEPCQDHHRVGPVRIVLCSICTILIFTTIALHITGHRSSAAVCEWVVVMAFFVLFGLFGVELRHIDCHRLAVQKHGRGTPLGSNDVLGLSNAA